MRGELRIKEKACEMCGAKIKLKCGNHRFCDNCKKERKKQSYREKGNLYRLNSCINILERAGYKVIEDDTPPSSIG